jgi:hypothetical protein
MKIAVKIQGAYSVEIVGGGGYNKKAIAQVIAKSLYQQIRKDARHGCPQ